MIIFLYHFLVLLGGWWISKRFLDSGETILQKLIVYSSVGLLVSIPLTYVFAVVSQSSGDPLAWGMLLYILLVSLLILVGNPSRVIRLFYRNLITSEYTYTRAGVPLMDSTVIIGCTAVAWYIMAKTLGIDTSGNIWVAKHTLFDFGHSLGIIRSMSWGNNIPYTSPFVAGTQHIYHFMYHYWVALWERQGISLTTAINVTSAYSFLVFLISIYSIGKIVFKSRFVGIIAILLIIFHGGLLFIPFITKYGFSLNNLIHLSDYLFVGPFDGSLYSIFITLNVFVNQRHLALSLGLFFWLYHWARQKSTDRWDWLILGFLIANMFLWHIVLSVGLFISIVLYFMLSRHWSKIGWVSVSYASTVGIILIPWFPYLWRGLLGVLENGLGPGASGGGISGSIWMWVLSFFTYNFGITLVFVVLGALYFRYALRYFLPVLLLISFFMILSIPARIIDQKYLNILTCIFALFAANGIARTWSYGVLMKLLVLGMFPLLILSGIIDFMVIKNDFRYPISFTGSNQLVSYIKENTEPSDVILSYEDILDPVTLAGRKHFYGFYKQPDILWETTDRNRYLVVKKIYGATNKEELINLLQESGISFIILPPDSKQNLPFIVSPLIDQQLPLLIDVDEHRLYDARGVTL